MSIESNQKIIELLQEQLRWTRVVSAPQVKIILSAAFADQSEKIIYELTDGKRSIRDIERLTKTGKFKIWKLWGKWETMGIAERINASGTNRIKHSFSLANLGIDVPDIPELQAEQNEKENDIE